MSWITNLVPPRIQALMSRKEVPDNLWIKCPSCAHMLFQKDLKEHLSVCHYCNHHFRWPILERLRYLLSDYEETKLPTVTQDPLKFKDTKRYIDRLKDYKAKTQKEEAVILCSGKIDIHPVSCIGFNFEFMGGSMSTGVGEAFLKGVEHAISKNSPFIAFVASGGARMQEGILSLMQMPRTVIGVQKLKENKIPYLVVLTDPTMGGVSASFAMLGDIHIAELGSVIGFAGARVIEETIKQKLPSGFQKAEYLLDHGMIDHVVHRKNLKETLKNILLILSKR
jgi:acetyl-CoA carboxylase carboxyl transferase subunit beta